MLYAIDSASGETRSTIHGLFRGDIRSMQNLSSSLILLSDDLKVYDVVADELRYGDTSRPRGPVVGTSRG